MGWIKEKLWELSDVLEEFPKVYWLTMFYVALAAISVFMYVPLFSKIADLNLLGATPFKQTIIESWNMLRWGLIVSPITILLIGWIHAADLYERLMRKRYGYR
ncbi:hypothetical protein [Acinetobacter sp. YH1901134]|uniref:hypothetical protein n=1 Tax=Acinetobacter sp. YH1901134 TaxID=2601199 RepID=UPI0015D3177F|nr:hypothetical protein [Acinetobacter sp. YH1901134]